jgi:phosphoribosyl-AMP cyclohydrolase / phosphoribosyl-ATP pyrophosphohydrolase
MIDVSAIDFSKLGGLVPAVVQDAEDGRVLMVGFMNEEALRRTLETGRVTFFSRSRGRLWTKGEESGNHIEVVCVEADCDADTLLVAGRPAGPVCHRGTPTCFEGGAFRLGFLAELERVLDARLQERPEGSYVARLASKGLDAVAQKVGEEAVETVIAAKNPDLERLLDEAADLVFHTMFLLRQRGLRLADVAQRLEERHRARG